MTRAGDCKVASLATPRCRCGRTCKDRGLSDLGNQGLLEDTVPFANSYLPITYSSELISKKPPIPLPILYCFELVRVTVSDGPVSVLPPPSQNCTKVTDS